MRMVTINWKFPKPRKGFAGSIDRFIGPGVTRSELVLQLLVPTAAACIAPLYAWQIAAGWSVWQYVVAGLIAFDVVGGVATNATSTAKRWYHREGQGFLQHFGFIVLHLLHLILVSWLYLNFETLWIFITGGYLLLSSAVILLTPLYLQRPVAMVLYVGAIVVSLTAVQIPLGLEWFLPVFYLKLLVCHAVREEPYRPDQEV